MKIGFYTLGKKGYFTLLEYAKEYGHEKIDFVVSAKDGGVDNDWFAEIESYCFKCGVFFLEYQRGSAQLPRRMNNENYCFAVGWKWLISDKENVVVFHDSLLPKYRGFSPLVNMLVDGVKEIGVTALIASEQYDGGGVITQSKKVISYPIKIANAIDEIIPLYTELLLKVASEIQLTGTLNAIRQDEGNATYSLWRDEMDYFIDWMQNAEQISRFVDAVGAPYSGAAVLCDGKKLRVIDVETVQDVDIENRKNSTGKVIFMNGGCPVIVCQQGLLQINDLRTEDNQSLIGKIPFRSRFTRI